MSTQIRLGDGRLLHAHDDGSGPAVVWHHGSPQTGAPLEPVLAATRARGLRLVSYGRPSCGGSTPRPGRDVASAAADVAELLDALGIEQAAHLGASGGGPHALACAALLPARTRATVSIAGLAPFVDGFDWSAGMASDAALRAAALRREARAALPDEDVDAFVDADWAALAGPWAALGADVGRAVQDGPDGLIDDDVAFAHPWGFDPATISSPVLLVHGGRDRVVPPSHGQWLLEHLPRAELWPRSEDGHVSVLSSVPDALDWVLEHW